MTTDLKKHPDYRDGCRAALLCKPMDFVSAEFDAGYAAGKKVVEEGTFEPVEMDEE